MAANPDTEAGAASVLRLRHLDMFEHIHRTENPAWCHRLERQQVLARLGRHFAHEPNPLEAMCEQAQALKQGLRATATLRRLGPA